MRAIIYRRVSDEKQTEKYSLPAQLKLCRELCHRNGWQVVKELADEGYSGALFEERPGFSELFQFAGQKRIDVIVVTDLDRLARPDNLVDLGRIQKILIENNVKLATISGRISDLSNSSDWFFSSLESLMAGWERKKIKERVKRGVKEKKLQGYFWGTTEPSGYIKEKGMLISNPVRMEKIGKGGHRYTILSSNETKEIFNLYLTGEAVISISRKMNVSDNTISGILDRAMFYAGYILDMRDEGRILAKGLHEPIIPETQARNALELRSEKHKIHQKSRERYPALGLIKCAVCNASINLKMSVKREKRYYHYICGNRRFAIIRRIKHCTLPTFRVSDVEAKIWNTTEKIVTSPENVFKMLSNSNLFLQHCYDRLLNIESELSSLTQRKKRLMELYEFINTNEEIKEHRIKIEKLESQMLAKQNELATIQNDIKMQESAPRKHGEIIKTLEIFQEIITEAEESEKRQILRSLFKTILLHPNGEISYKLQIPMISPETPVIGEVEPWKVSQIQTTECFSSTNFPNLRRMSWK